MSISTPYEDAELIKAQRKLNDGEHFDALMAADQALRLNPLRHEALFLAGLALYRGDAPGAALPILNLAAKLNPHFQTWNAIGCCLTDLHPKDAYAAFREAHKLDPANGHVLSNLAAIACNLGRYEEAKDWTSEALKVNPQNREVVYNAALALLGEGRWAEAWSRYAVAMPNKFREERFYDEAHSLPRWDGREGEKVVIYGEQGLGDEILFMSMAEEAFRSGSEIIIETDWKLENLFRRSFPEATVYGTRWETYCEWPDQQKPTMKLEMGGLGELYAPVPFRRDAYLKPDPEKQLMARAWLDKVCAKGTLRVGIAWSGGAWHTGRATRSLDLHEMLPILSAPNVEFVCLEYDDPKDALERLPRDDVSIQPIHDLRSFVKKGADYDDTAALVAELDLVIAPTTSVVDLAGALGKPCWALVNTNPQWRYAEKAGEDQMWFYESVRCYRQKQEGQWGAPVAAIAKDLRALAMREAA